MLAIPTFIGKAGITSNPPRALGLPTSDFGFPLSCFPLLLGLLLSGCQPATKDAEVPGAKVTGDTVVMVTNSPQLAALSVEPVGAEQPAFVPLTGRLVWDEDATVRVFTPFAGIVRKLFVDVNQPVTNGMALAEIQSPDFAQAQAGKRASRRTLSTTP